MSNDSFPWEIFLFVIITNIVLILVTTIPQSDKQIYGKTVVTHLYCETLTINLMKQKQTKKRNYYYKVILKLLQTLSCHKKNHQHQNGQPNYLEKNERKRKKLNLKINSLVNTKKKIKNFH